MKPGTRVRVKKNSGSSFAGQTGIVAPDGIGTVLDHEPKSMFFFSHELEEVVAS